MEACTKVCLRYVAHLALPRLPSGAHETFVDARGSVVSYHCTRALCHDPALADVSSAAWVTVSALEDWRVDFVEVLGEGVCQVFWEIFRAAALELTDGFELEYMAKRLWQAANQPEQTQLQRN